MPEQFHFIHPAWLLTLLPLALLVWLLRRQVGNANPWRRIVDARLLPLLMNNPLQAGNRSFLWLLAAGWLLAALALADPSWEQLPQAVVQTTTSRVIVLDLSRSMLAADLQPSRLVRARFKVEDMLAHDNEGQTGLVVFAGDAFSVTPLTRDADTIRAQLKALEPDIMPVQGSRADLGLQKAGELLRQAGVSHGQVILVADGVEGDRAERAAARLRQSGFRVSVLGAGTDAGAPLPDGQGGTIRDASGKVRLVRLESPALKAVARAGGGRYSRLTAEASDIDYLLDDTTGRIEKQDKQDLKTRRWKEQGPLLAVLLLPLAALAFRRGWLVGVLLCTTMLSQPRPAAAFGWNDLWLRPDQQATKALQQGDYEQAARLAQDPARRGSAEYRKGDYGKALDAFSKGGGADAAYNRGNALAKQGRYQQAVAAYREALQAQPGMKDAIANKAAVEALLEKQQQQQDSQQSSGGQDKQDQQQQGKSGQQKNGQDQQAGNGQSSAGSDKSTGQQAGKDSKGSGSGSASGDRQPAGEKQATDGKRDGKQAGDKDNAFARASRALDKQGNEDAHDGQAPDNTGDDRQAERQGQPGNDKHPPGNGHATAHAEQLSSEEQLAAQQWLRRIPDDPGGLLRRKFLYQYRQRTQPGDNTQDW